MQAPILNSITTKPRPVRNIQEIVKETRRANLSSPMGRVRLETLSKNMRDIPSGLGSAQ